MLWEEKSIFTKSKLDWGGGRIQGKNLVSSSSVYFVLSTKRVIKYVTSPPQTHPLCNIFKVPPFPLPSEEAWKRSDSIFLQLISVMPHQLLVSPWGQAVQGQHWSLASTGHSQLINIIMLKFNSPVLLILSQIGFFNAFLA